MRRDIIMMESSVSTQVQCTELEDDFAPSKLVTKKYWDDAYKRELQTYKDIGDVGEIWFGEESMDRAKHGFSNLTGIDYSKAAVELTVNILKEEGLKIFKIQVMEMICTFDAISLRPEDREEAKKCYVNSLKTVMQPGGFFIITSCNWTKEQLLQIFTPGFELVQELATPHFQCGGVTGNSVTALEFKKID
uniref:EEF1A lysine methyltransferase 2 n=1 Tax=Cyprinus carpio TaxID=7962 RepID=A0A8C1KGI7_CYPCA